MCELLAMNSKFATNVNFSMNEFSLHGGATGPHEDGWGIAYAMGRDFRLIKEPRPAFDSTGVKFIQESRFQSHLVISHIRRATIPKVLTFENTHPFDRELFGRRFVFAHNGHIAGLGEGPGEGLPGLPGFMEGRQGGRFLPMGETDSEKVFCHFLNAIERRVGTAEQYNYRKVEEVLQELSPGIRAMGRLNYLLSDSEHLFAHGDNSLHSVCRTCHLEETRLESNELSVLVADGPDQEAVVVATVPLTGSESWSTFAPGEIRVFHKGRQV